MELRTIFTKPVDRTIEGVIKADDEASLRLEVEEYVLTNEVSKRLEAFLDAYNNYEGANGVWISGFFGSGKSHLLKIMALLLENRAIDGIPVIDMFLAKPGLQDNEILRGGLKRAVAIPSKSILFNIDQKADVISKTQLDALLAVFVKVFDEMCGYYGKQGHIAQFERDLDSREIYHSFKENYRALAGKEWSVGREQALLESGNIAAAYAKAAGAEKASAVGILDRYRSDYKVSIEDFAEKVHSYVESQGPNFRLNFFVDEVGQYIAENIKLMTNLQTIAESLATRCRGRAWIIVTAQEEMKDVVGEMNNQQGNDFTKIQARFASRMKLTSADVAEVIQKRLLMKNETGVKLLSDVYHEQTNNFKTLFDFADGSQTYRNFQDRDHFIHSYPFIPYQYTLFQAAIQNLSDHNTFEGKHSSVGERSMLGVFQQVAVHIACQELGQLATFDLMFEGVRTALKAQAQRAILTAEKQLASPFGIRLLKALFLVKYVREFKATVRNLCILMRESFSQDLPTLRKSVEEALNLLEHETYIQRNGEQYEYLTDEEKDIEQEIKNTEVETGDVADELAKLVFDIVIKNRKIRYDENGQDYPYTRKLDDRLVGREYELAIHIISPFYEHSGNDIILRPQSMGRDELMVIMPPDDRLVRDLLMYKRTEKYVKQNILITQQEGVKRILNDKTFQNQERHRALQLHVGRLLGTAKLIIQGGDVEIAGEDPQTRIFKGFYELILRTYRNLRMLRGIAYTENDIQRCLKQSEDGLFGNDATTVAESEQEMLAFILGNSRKNIRTTVKGLVENFERKPYGWYFAAILCILAKLCARGKIEVRADANILEEAELERAIRNTHLHGNIILEPQLDFTASQVRQLKEFYEDFFDNPPGSSEAKALGKETAAAFQSLINSLTLLVAQKSHYPFLSALDAPLAEIREIAGKPYTFYLTEFSRQAKTMLDLKETTLDPVRRFMTGVPKDLYDEARKFLQSQEPNFSYVDNERAIRIQEAMDDPQCFKGDHMQQVKSLVDTLKADLEAKLAEEKGIARNAIKGLQAGLSIRDEFVKISSAQQSQLLLPFGNLLRNMERQTIIAVIRDTRRRFEDDDYPRMLTQLSTWSNPEPKKGADHPRPDENTVKVEEKVIEYVSGKSIRTAYDKLWLADESDVDRYLKAMREALLAEIRKGKRIQI
ncbi:MAG: BREX system P-loop protein BrxC [Syntrophales bacterium]